MATPKEEYEARKAQRRAILADKSHSKESEAAQIEMVLDMADRAITALEGIAAALAGIEMNLRKN